MLKKSLEKPIKINKRVSIGIFSENSSVSPTMAMFLSAQSCLLDEFDSRIHDGSIGMSYNNVIEWLGLQDSDYYIIINGSLSPVTDNIQRLILRNVDVIVPPIILENKNGIVTNIFNKNGMIVNLKECGFESIENASLDFVCLSRKALCSFLMSLTRITNESLLSPIKELGFNIYVDWTIEPVTRWENESADRKSRILNSYGIWHTRIKRGLSV